MGSRSNSNLMLKTLGDFSKSNLALLMCEDMHEAMRSICCLAGRSSGIEFFAKDVTISTIIREILTERYEAVFIRSIDEFDRQTQIKLAEQLKTLDSKYRGKIIATTRNFNQVETELRRQFCSIKECFTYSEVNDDFIHRSFQKEDGNNFEVEENNLNGNRRSIWNLWGKLS